jgi:hypothetical protein
MFPNRSKTPTPPKAITDDVFSYTYVLRMNAIHMVINTDDTIIR